jgi:hypothetical protein
MIIVASPDQALLGTLTGCAAATEVGGAPEAVEN